MENLKSRDYNKLYDFICKGGIAACLVDYDMSKFNVPPLRDISKVGMDEKGNISFGVRGLQQGSVDAYDVERFGKSKKEFLNEQRTETY